ncbi:aminotransferase class V-fold PLP-dependent enzyme [Candidatus Parcubacteria bacterium]|nr:aminotransferase class V-fold PLP-dependent enzyme [Patescibacteria group bacterium]MCG2693811.1 aminotransferase class V-fold PLP-dependent enzyme [Candidatus Parcubacteria bacterium]
MDLHNIRQDFPIFKNQPNLVYFDNACMTLRPQCVIDAVRKYYEEYPVCAGRSAYRLAEKLTADIEDVRANVAKFIGAKKEEVVFTKNTTEAINIVAQGLNWQEGDIVLGTDKEHNSNLTPWLKLVKERGIKYYAINPSEIVNKIKELKPRLVAVQSFSNLDGTKIILSPIIEEAHNCGALVLVDGAQAVPHEVVDVWRNDYKDVDFLAFSGHKMCGPSGTGVLYGKRELLEKLNPLLVGGGAIANSKYDDYELLPLPEKLEAGLQDYAGILGLGEAVKYIEKIGIKNIEAHEKELNNIVTNGLKDEEKIKIIGPADSLLRGGIFTFYINGVSSHEVAIMLDNMANVAVRSGQFCVHSWFNANEVADAVRTSFYFYNTPEEAEKFVEVMKNIIKIY